MTVRQYQQVNYLNSNVPNELERMAYVVMELFNLSYDEVDLMPQKKFLKKIKRVTKQFAKANNKPFWYLKKLQTDATKLNLGQFVEAVHFLKTDAITNLHQLVATLSKKEGDDHAAIAIATLSKPINYYLSDVLAFMQNFQMLLNSYRGLFEIGEEEQEEIEEKPIKKSHPFVEQYGWIFSAKQIAEFEGIPLEKAYDLGIVHALNTLSLLKSKADYEKHLNK